MNVAGPSNAQPNSEALTEEQKKKQEMIDALLQRVKLSKAGRILQQRLALASYKTQHGWQTAKLEQLEPHAEQKAQERDRKRKAQEAIDQNQQAKKIALASQQQNDRPVHARQDSDRGLPPQMSLYDAMMTPSLGGGLFDSFSPRLSDNSFSEFPSNSGPHNNYMPTQSSGLAPAARLNQDPSRPGLSISTALANSAATLHHPASPVSSARDTPMMKPGSPLGKVDSPHRRNNSMPVHPLSTRDPSFAGNASDFVNAATALTNLTSGASEEAIPGPSRVTPPPQGMNGPSHGSPKSGRPRARTNPGGEQDAAELMLYLAQSPSPGPVNRKVSMSQLGEGEGMKGRLLFAQQDGPEEARQALQSQSSTSLSQAAPASFQPQHTHQMQYPNHALPPAASHMPQHRQQPQHHQRQQHLQHPMMDNNNMHLWPGQSHNNALVYGMHSAPLLHASSPYNNLPARSATPPSMRPNSPFDLNAYLNVSPGRSTSQSYAAHTVPSSYGGMW